MGTSRTVHRSCNLCEASCGLTIEVEGPTVLSIRGDELDPFSRGYVCPKGIALQDLQTDPDRLRTPGTPCRRRHVAGDRLGRGARPRRRPAHRDPRPRRRRRHRALPRQPDHPRLGTGDVHPDAHRRARHARALQRGERRPAAAAPARLPAVRVAADVPGARPRPHRPPARGRRQPGGEQRLDHDRAGHEGPARGAARPRRARGGDRPAAHRDGRRRRRARPRGPGHRRVAARRDAAGDHLRGARRARAARRTSSTGSRR